MAEEGWESGATALPAPKKSLERALLAVEDAVSLLLVVFLETPRADVQQRDVGVGGLLVSRLLIATPLLIELNADVLSVHEGSWDAIDPVGSCLLLPAGLGAAAAGTAIARGTGSVAARVALEILLVSSRL